MKYRCSSKDSLVGRDLLAMAREIEWREALSMILVLRFDIDRTLPSTEQNARFIAMLTTSEIVSNRAIEPLISSISLTI